MSRTPLLIDVDTGVDDAMAIALATRLESHELLGITTVAGNVGLDHTTRNTLRVLSWLDVGVPVYRGMSGPLVRPLETGAHVHGQEGLGGWQAPESPAQIANQTAPEAIISLAREHRGQIDFAFVGPLTNLAVALRLEPELPSMVNRLVIMGGAFFKAGNTSVAAEFNVHVDPEAAAAVANASFNATWVGLDVTHQTVLDRNGWDELRDSDVQTAVLVREVCRGTFEDRALDISVLHDPLAIASLESPDLLEVQRGQVTIGVGAAERGRTRLAVAARDDVEQNVATAVDVARFDSIFQRLLG